MTQAKPESGVARGEGVPLPDLESLLLTLLSADERARFQPERYASIPFVRVPRPMPCAILLMRARRYMGKAPT